MRTILSLILLVLAACDNQPPVREQTQIADRTTHIGSCQQREADQRVIQIALAIQGRAQKEDEAGNTLVGAVEETFLANGLEYTFRTAHGYSPTPWLQIWQVPEGKRGDGPVLSYTDDDGDAFVDFAFGSVDRPNNGEFRNCDWGTPQPELEQFWQGYYNQALDAAVKHYRIEL